MFFFFKQKTAYEMRISDWSSDVCSSDLSLRYRSRETKRSSWFSADRSRSPEPAPPLITAFDAMLSKARTRSSPGTVISAINACDGNKPRTSGRSEERRVGKECVSRCRSRWSPYHYKNKPQEQLHV